MYFTLHELLELVHFVFVLFIRLFCRFTVCSKDDSKEEFPQCTRTVSYSERNWHSVKTSSSSHYLCLWRCVWKAYM